MERRRAVEFAAGVALVIILAGSGAGLLRYWEYLRVGPSLLAIAEPLAAERQTEKRAPLWGQLSPEGRRLLQWRVQSGSVRATIRTVPDGTTVERKAELPGVWARGSGALWFPDSRRWVGLAAGGKSLYAVAQSLDCPNLVRKIPLGLPRWTVVFPDLMQSELLGFVSAGRVLARPHQDHWPRGGKPRKVPFYQFSVGSGPANLEEYEILLPAGLDLAEVALAPTGTHLAWLLHEAPEAGPHTGKLMTVLIALSRTDGSELQVLGHVPRSLIPTIHQAPRTLTWSEDGRHLQFHFRNLRWILQVPQARGNTAG